MSYWLLLYPAVLKHKKKHAKTWYHAVCLGRKETTAQPHVQLHVLPLPSCFLPYFMSVPTPLNQE
jgi:hypothetical protein